MNFTFSGLFSFNSTHAKLFASATMKATNNGDDDTNTLEINSFVSDGVTAVTLANLTATASGLTKVYV